MAIGKTTNVGRRRVVYGANVIVQIALVVIVTVGIVYVARGRGQLDLTSSGANSLSQRTEQMLRGLDQDVTITAIYTVLSEYDERALKRRDTVGDLLKLYESAGRGHVTANLIDPMKDRARLPVLLKRLREKPAYQDEADKHEQALADFPLLNEAVRTLVGEQTARIEQLLSTDESLKETVLLEIGQELRRLVRKSEDVSLDVHELVSYDIPHYGKAIESARAYLESVRRFLEAVGDWVGSDTAADRGLPPAVVQFLEGIDGEYQAVLPDVDEFLSSTAELERVKLEDLSDQLSRWSTMPPILIETADKAVVLGFAEVWPYRMDANAPPAADGDDREFAGEQAISSALLKLTQKERTAVVFVRYGGQSPIVPDFSQMQTMRQIPRAPYGLLNDLLGQQNFITEDWDVKVQKSPPVIEDAARTVYVVMPPAPPEQPDPRRPSPEPPINPEDVRIVTDAVESSGLAIFLTGAADRMLGGSGGYEYADYLESTWGIESLHEYVTIRFTPSQENPELYVPRRPPLVIDTTDRLARARFTDHPIGRPLQPLGGGFIAVCPLRMLESVERPDGVHVEEVALVDQSTDIWAVRDITQFEQRLKADRGTVAREDDIKPPYPIALAGERSVPKEESPEADSSAQRVVVFSSTGFAANPMLEAPGGYAFTGAGLVAYAAYPANPDLFINAVHWLTDDADRISVSARRTEVPRLDKLSEGFWMDFWRVFLVGIWPGVALIVGGGVWLVRRR